jgi:hypothetical protein
VQVGGKALAFRWDAGKRLLEVALPALRQAPMQVAITL